MSETVFLVFRLYDNHITETYYSNHLATFASRESAVLWCENQEGRKLNWIAATSKSNQTARIDRNYIYEIEESEVME